MPSLGEAGLRVMTAVSAQQLRVSQSHTEAPLHRSGVDEAAMAADDVCSWGCFC